MIGKLENFSTVFLILGGRNFTDIRFVYVTVEFIGYVVPVSYTHLFATSSTVIEFLSSTLLHSDRPSRARM